MLNIQQNNYNIQITLYYNLFQNNFAAMTVSNPRAIRSNLEIEHDFQQSLFSNHRRPEKQNIALNLQGSVKAKQLKVSWGKIPNFSLN
jgi:hypothetical protein